MFWCEWYDTMVLGEWCDVVLGEWCEWGDALVLEWVVLTMWCGVGWVVWCCDVGWVVNEILQCWASDVSIVILWCWVNDVMWCLVSGVNDVTLWCWVSSSPYFKGRWHLHLRGFNNPRRMTWIIWPLKMKVIQSFNQEPLTQKYNVTPENESSTSKLFFSSKHDSF
jgi:hypothetical protein